MKKEYSVVNPVKFAGEIFKEGIFTGEEDELTALVESGSLVEIDPAEPEDRTKKFAQALAKLDGFEGNPTVKQMASVGFVAKAPEIKELFNQHVAATEKANEATGDQSEDA